MANSATRFFDPFDWAETALTSRGIEDAWARASRSLTALGFENQTFIFDQPVNDRVFPPKTRVFGDVIDAEWHARLRTHRDLQINDPAARRFTASERAVHAWKGSPFFHSLNEAERRFYRYYEEHGFKAGVIWPSHDRKAGTFNALFTCTKEAEAGFIREVTQISGAAHLAVTYLCEALRVKELAERTPAAALSPREKECLLWVQAGKATKDISDRLMIAEATINEYIAAGMKKLQATNRAQAAARATMLALIQP